MKGVINNGLDISVIDLPDQLAKENKETDRPSRKNHAEIENEKRTQPKKHSLLILGLSELVATGLLMFLGCMGCVGAVDPMPLPHHLSAIAFGLVIMLIIQTFGHISGAHLNPVVTLAALFLGMLGPFAAFIYVAAQFVGAILGFSLLKIMIPSEYVATEFYDSAANTTFHKLGLCSTVPADNITLIQALAMESVLTCVLILIVCAVWDKRNSHNTDSTSLRFGLAIAAIAMIGGPFTGASMNTARSFAPALLNNDWKDHWIYWVGPNVGGLIGAIFYKICFSDPNEDKINNTYEDVPLKDTITKV